MKLLKVLSVLIVLFTWNFNEWMHDIFLRKNTLIANLENLSSIISQEVKAKEFYDQRNYDMYITSVNRVDAENIHDKKVTLLHQQAVINSLDLSGLTLR